MEQSLPLRLPSAQRLRTSAGDYGTRQDGSPEQPEPRRTYTQLALANTAVAALVAGVMALALISGVWSGPREGAAVVSADVRTAAAVVTAADTKPHIMFVTLDDVGSNDIGRESTDLHAITPYLSLLAANGVRLSNYYGQAVCTPARVALHTGKFVHRTGFGSGAAPDPHEILTYSNFSIPLSNRLLGERMSELGYTSFYGGKWNVGHCSERYLPSSRGYHGFVGYYTAGVDYSEFVTSDKYFLDDGTTALVRDFSVTTVNGAEHFITPDGSAFYTDSYVARTVGDWIRGHAQTHGATAGDDGSPLFLHLGFQGPHSDTGLNVSLVKSLIHSTLDNATAAEHALKQLELLYGADHPRCARAIDAVFTRVASNRAP